MEIDEAYAYIGQRSKDLGKYSDKLRENVKEIDATFTPLFERAGLYYIQTVHTDVAEAFYTEPGCSDEVDEYFFSIEKSGGGGSWGICYFQVCNDECGRWLGNAKREILRAAVPALPGFISEYAEFLGKETEEYRVVSEMAEAMNEAVQKVIVKEKEGNSRVTKLSLSFEKD